MKSKAIQSGLGIALATLITACAGDVNGVPEPRDASYNSITTGRRLIVSCGCASCHTISGVPGADASHIVDYLYNPQTLPQLNSLFERKCS